MAQNWNDVLEYIKVNLGAEINLIELSDDKIIKYLRNQVLSYFSQYSSKKNYLMINRYVNLIQHKTGQPQYQYKLPIREDEYIIDILDVYIMSSETVLNTFSYDYYGAIDSVMANSYIDAIDSIQPRNTWEFVPPDVLIFDLEIESAIVVYATEHDVLETIRPDFYHIMFKPLCLANVKLWLSSMRSKYEGLQTPFGAINLNWQELKQDGLQEKEKVEQMLAAIPPDKLIEISV